MKVNQAPLNRNLVPQRSDILPVKSPNQKIIEQSGGKAFVNCVSTMPLAFQTSKEQIRISYMHGILQGNMTDPKYNHLIGLPKTQMHVNPSVQMNNSTQPSKNPFIRSVNTIQQSHAINPLTQATGPGINIFSRLNNNMPNYNNSFGPNHFQNNKPQNQLRNMFGVSLNNQQNPGLVKQTSFAETIKTGSLPSTQNPTTPAANQTVVNHLVYNEPIKFFGDNQAPGQQPAIGVFRAITATSPVQNSSTITGNPLTGNILSQPNPTVSGQMPQYPSFNNLIQTNITQKPGIFGQAQDQNPQASIIGAQTNTTTNQTFGGDTNISGVLANQPGNVNFGQKNLPSQALTASGLDQNIKQLLQAKPNLWNILSLDPNYKHGFNQCGRIYVKSVLQRIIDQSIVSQDSLNKIIIQIYKQMYGAQNLQKTLQSKKKQSSNFDKVRQCRMDKIVRQECEKLNSQSLFPNDFNTVGQDFYRSTRRTYPKLSDPLSYRNQNDQEQAHLNRKYYQVKRPAKSIELKVKFVQIKMAQNKGSKSILNPYSEQKLDIISQNINELRAQHRSKITPNEKQLPDIEGFEIVPSKQSLFTYTKYELLSVPKVSISNEWGSIRFKAPISLLNKRISQCIVINQKSVEIIDQEWKVRDAQINFKKFANFIQLEEEEQNQLEDKIINWCERSEFQLIKIDKQTGQVVIQI